MQRSIFAESHTEHWWSYFDQETATRMIESLKKEPKKNKQVCSTLHKLRKIWNKQIVANA
jgi:hypothetical protein